MKAIHYIGALTAIFVGFFLYSAFTGEGIGQGFADIFAAAKSPGVQIMILDLYIGFLIIAGWFVCRNGFGIKAVIFTLALFAIGNLMALLYLLWLLVKSRGDVRDVILGPRA